MGSRRKAWALRAAMVLVMLIASEEANPAERLGRGNALLEQDWRFQAGGHPGYDHVRQEIARARRFAKELRESSQAMDVSLELEERGLLGRRLLAESGEQDRSIEKLYLAVRQLKRRIMLTHPAIDVSRILCIDQPRSRSGRESTHRHRRYAVPGGRLVILAGLHPDATSQHIVPQTAGSHWRPDLSFDGRQVLFCFNPEGDMAFHSYEVGVHGRRQVRHAAADDHAFLQEPANRTGHEWRAPRREHRSFESAPADRLGRRHGALPR